MELCDSLTVAVVERLAEGLVVSVVLVVSDVDPLLLNVAVIVHDDVEENVNVVLPELVGEKLAVLLVVVLVLVVKLPLDDGDTDIERVPEDVSDALVVTESLPEWVPLVIAL